MFSLITNFFDIVTGRRAKLMGQKIELLEIDVERYRAERDSCQAQVYRLHGVVGKLRAAYNPTETPVEASVTFFTLAEPLKPGEPLEPMK